MNWRADKTYVHEYIIRASHDNTSMIVNFSLQYYRTEREIWHCKRLFLLSHLLPIQRDSLNLYSIRASKMRSGVAGNTDILVPNAWLMALMTAGAVATAQDSPILLAP